MQVPTVKKVTVAVETVQTLTVVEVNVTALPEAPPVAVTVYVEPATFAAAGAVEVMLKLWAALLKVKDTVVVAALKLLSAAFVTVKVQVPEEVALRVEPLNEQPVAVPSVTDEMLSAPVPDPPVTEFTVNEVCEYGKVLLVALRTGEEIAL